VEGVLTDMAGRQMGRVRLTLPAGNVQWRSPVAHLAAGIYQLSLFTRDGVAQTIRWVKK